MMKLKRSYFFVVQGIFEVFSSANCRKNNAEIRKNSHFLNQQKSFKRVLSISPSKMFIMLKYLLSFIISILYINLDAQPLTFGECHDYQVGDIIILEDHNDAEYYTARIRKEITDIEYGTNEVTVTWDQKTWVFELEEESVTVTFVNLDELVCDDYCDVPLSIEYEADSVSYTAQSVTHEIKYGGLRTTKVGNSQNDYYLSGTDTLPVQFLGSSTEFIEGLGSLTNGWFSDAEGSSSTNWEVRYYQKGETEWGDFITFPSSGNPISNEHLEIASAQFTVYPNPITPDAHIFFDELVMVEGFHIYDLQGRLVYEKLAKGLETKELSLGELALKQGFYFLKVQTDDGMASAKLYVP